MIVGRSDYSLRAASEVLPMRDAFAVRLRWHAARSDRALGTAGVRPRRVDCRADRQTCCGAADRLDDAISRYPFRAGLTVAIPLAQIGKFSFILAPLGRELGVFTPAATNLLVATSIASIVLNPLVYRAIAPIEAWVNARPRLRSALDRERAVLDADGLVTGAVLDPSRRAVVIGYGPTGRAVVELLNGSRIESTVIELNMETVRALRERGIQAVYGDATRPETLIVAAGVPMSGILILGSAGMAERLRNAQQPHGSEKGHLHCGD